MFDKYESVIYNRLILMLNNNESRSMQKLVKANAVYQQRISTHDCHRALQDTISQLRNHKDKKHMFFRHVFSFDTVNRYSITAVLVSLNVPSDMVESRMKHYSTT